MIPPLPPVTYIGTGGKRMNRKKGHRDYNGKNSGDRVATFSTASMTSLGRSRWSCNGINNEDRGCNLIFSDTLSPPTKNSQT